MKIFISFIILFLIPRACSGMVPDTLEIRPLETYVNDILDSGGILLEEQGALQIHHYDLDIFLDMEEEMIFGSVMTYFKILDLAPFFVMHLDTLLVVERVLLIQPQGSHEPLEFRHENGLILAHLPEWVSANEHHIIEISYFGSPRTAPNPPWQGGFSWETTPCGKPWVGVTCQLHGADIWWPVKDHPSDRPDSVSLKITVPESLVALSNGILESVEQYTDDTRTFHWKTRHPISNYAVSMNIGPYKEIEEIYQSVTGETFPVFFWALPHNIEKARELMKQILDQLRFFEEILGPYPFRDEKYGVVETPYLGMEHQTLVAYGAGYKNDVVFNTGSGFDDLHHHELAHEWWGNLISVEDWKDVWIHEGFATYMQPLYAEYLHGKEQYQTFMKTLYGRMDHQIAVAPKTVKSSREMFQGRDIYMKGAWILHTLRFYLGDELFFLSLRTMLYPDPDLENPGVAPPSRLVNTKMYIDLVNDLSGEDTNWFFQTYLRHTELPELHHRREGRNLYLWWTTPHGGKFPMPVEIMDGDRTFRVIPEKDTPIVLDHPGDFLVDPFYRVLRKEMYR